MFRTIFASSVLLATLGATPARAFPAPADTPSRLPTEMCYYLAIETTPLGPTSPDDAVSLSKVPFCVDFRGYFDVPTGLANCQLGPTSDYRCSYAPLLSNGYVTVRTDRVEFQARTRTTPGTMQGFDFYASRGLTLSTRFFLDTNWDFRVNQILAQHKADLDVRLESLILPSLTYDDRGMRLDTAGKWADADAAFVLDPGNCGNSLNPVSAIGYDAANREYDVRLWIEQGEVRFASR